MGLLIRLIFAFLLVAATFNPTQANFVRWAAENYQARLSLTVLFGLVLLIGYVIFLRATLRSIGALGVVLVLAVVGALVWVLADFGLLSLDNRDLVAWLGVFAVSAVLGVGLGWSFVRRALSGQYDVDDADD